MTKQEVNQNLFTFDRLSTFTSVESNLLNTTNAYEYYLGRAKVVYDQWFNNLDNPRKEYRPYQYEYAALYASRRFNICAGSQGIGKTYIAGIMIAAIYGKDLELLRPGSIHIVVPTRLVAATRWLSDLSNIELLKDQVELITSEKQLLQSEKPIWIYQQDFIKRNAKALAHRETPKSSRKTINRLMFIKNRYPKLLIYDEVHHLQGASARTNNYLFLRKKAKRVLALSGTLSDGRLEMINTVCQFVYGKSRWEFNKHSFLTAFATKTKLETNYLTGEERSLDIEVTPRYLSHLAINKVPTYYKLIRRFVHRVSINDPNVLSVVRVPDRLNHVLNIKPTERHLQAYRERTSQYFSDLSNARLYGNTMIGRNRAFSLIKPLIDISSFPEFEVPAKAIKCLELLKEFSDRHQKTVIFVKHIRTARLLMELITERFGFSKVVRMYASDPEAIPNKLSMDQRQEIHSEFMFNNEVQIGIFSIGIASEGIDLTCASNVIFYDLPFQSITISQAICRVVRPGSVSDLINIYYLNHIGTIDQHIYKLLEEKLSKANLLLDFDVAEQNNGDTGTIDVIDVINNLLLDF